MKTKIRKIGSKTYFDDDKSVIWTGDMDMVGPKVTRIVVNKDVRMIGEVYLEAGDENYEGSVCQVIFVH